MRKSSVVWVAGWLIRDTGERRVGYIYMYIICIFPFPRCGAGSGRRARQRLTGGGVLLSGMRAEQTEQSGSRIRDQGKTGTVWLAG